jgi:hypothetical protein
LKITLIKKEIKRKMLKYLPALAILLVVFIAAQQYDSYNQSRLKSVQDKANVLSSQIIRIRTDYDEAEKILKTYMAIDKNKFPTDDGFAVGRDRLRALLPIIKELKDTYSFKTLNLTLSEIKENSTAGIQGFKVYENNIQLDFAGLTDEMVYSFIKDLKHEIPGYINIKVLQITRVADINSASVDSYFLKHDVAFVQGKIELEWATMQNVVKENPETVVKAPSSAASDIVPADTTVTGNAVPATDSSSAIDTNVPSPANTNTPGKFIPGITKPRAIKSRAPRE